MIIIKQNADMSGGLQGTDANDGEFVAVSVPYTASSPLTMSAAVFSRRMVVKAITLNPDVAATNAVTVSCFKAPSATVLGSGTVLHSGTGNLQGVAGTNLALTLSVVSGICDVPAGSRIGVVISGALGAAGSGVVTFMVAPA